MVRCLSSVRMLVWSVCMFHATYTWELSVLDLRVYPIEHVSMI